MRVFHFIPSIHDEASGPSYSVPALCGSLRVLGVDIEIHTTGISERVTYSFPVRVYKTNRLIPAMCISPDLKQMLKDQPGVDVFHTHSLWAMTNVYPVQYRNPKTKVMCAPRGTLSTWALNRSKWKKRLMWTVFQKRSLLNADCIHATSEKELEEIRRVGLTQPVAILPNGIDVQEPRAMERPANQCRRLLFFGRIHPVKGLPMLLEAWSNLQDRFKDWELVICGADADGHQSELIRQGKTLNLQRCNFQGPVYGKEKIHLYQTADLYVLPSHTENYAMTVAESLAAGVPVLTTTGTPWIDLAQRGCGWTCEPTKESLQTMLAESLTVPKREMVGMGEYGRQWMASEFSWDQIARKTLVTYQWLQGQTDKPEWVT